MNDYANQARNAVCGEPQQVFIVLDNVLSRKAARYFEAEETERENILRELDARGAAYFIGDDRTKNSVMMAYNDAIAFIEDNRLYTCDEEDSVVKSFDEVYVIGKENSATSKRKKVEKEADEKDESQSLFG